MTDTADAVVVGGGTVGAWCAYFLRRAGLARVVLIEKGFLGQGASSRAAGVVRVQGGTPEAVRLSSWSRRFYLGQRDEIGTDSGFTEQSYLLPCFTAADVASARSRMKMQTALGVPVRWLDPAEVDAANPTLARADARRHLLRPGRVRRAAAQRGRLHGGADPQRRRGPRARRLPRPGRR
jgi:sarcosine oxidase subunit beta